MTRGERNELVQDILVQLQENLQNINDLRCKVFNAECDYFEKMDNIDEIMEAEKKIIDDVTRLQTMISL